MRIFRSITGELMGMSYNRHLTKLTKLVLLETRRGGGAGIGR